MNFEDFSEKACCPYNKNHIFDKEKYIFHLNRCKDKDRIGHLFASCQYNRTHIVPKEDLATHEIVCPDQRDMKRLTQQLKKTLEETEKERQRSREKLKREEIKDEKIEKKQTKHQHPDDHVLFEDCPLCGFVVQKFDEIKKIVPPEVLTKIKQVEKMIKMNNQFTEKLKELDKVN